MLRGLASEMGIELTANPYRVVEACARILPPTGFLSLPPYAAAASGDDMT